SLAPLPAYLGPLGMTGLTAYFGILRKGDIKEGETVLVSGAAGAVGSMVGQIAKIKGCNVVGIAGSDEKCTYVTESLGFDACINYKTQDIKQAIKAACPNGIDVYFDNVGGDILDAALVFINRHARIVICGAISQYNNKEAVKGPSNYLSLLVNRARMEGMVVFDWADEYLIGIQDIAQWIMAGKVKFNIEEVDGIENFYEAFLKLFTGEKMGKLVLKI
ncbi:MAG: NADP-dependent oxidoreductase, partial [Saprospiraceae bacterium]|nr:NADP-dependent oxidoreductase [Saprospiraceae bacterium]